MNHAQAAAGSCHLSGMRYTINGLFSHKIYAFCLRAQSSHSGVNLMSKLNTTRARIRRISAYAKLSFESHLSQRKSSPQFNVDMHLLPPKAVSWAYTERLKSLPLILSEILVPEESFGSKHPWICKIGWIVIYRPIGNRDHSLRKSARWLISISTDMQHLHPRGQIYLR